MWIDRIELTDVGPVETADVRLPRPEARDLEFPNVVVLFGEHGAGKTTVLKAVAAALAGDGVGGGERASGPVPDWLRRGGSDDATAVVGLRGTRGTDAGRRTTTGFRIPRDAPSAVRRLGERPPDAVLRTIVGAAADRLWRSSAEALPAPVLDLLGQFIGPGPAAAELDDTAWLRERLPTSPAVRRAVAASLPPSVQLADDLEGGADGAVFVSHGRPVPDEELTDGVRSTLGWLLRLLRRLDEDADDGDTLDEVEGVALVDELDQRMHPGWQQRFLPSLARALPAVQFVATSHSPLVATGLRPANLLFVERPDDGDGGAVVSRLSEDVHGATIDVALTSSWFGLTSTRPRSFQRLLRDGAVAAAAGDGSAAFMRALLDADTPSRPAPTSRTPFRDRDGASGGRDES